MNTYGKNIKVTVFGQSHSKGIGVIIDGLPAGERIDFDRLNRFLKRRRPGNNELSSPRKEEDIPEFICGFVENRTCGAPVTGIIYNKDINSGDYEYLKNTPRPGHADYTAGIKYGEYYDYSGGGQFSGRLMAPLCIAGGICIQLLEKTGISVGARIYSIGDIVDNSEFNIPLKDMDLPVISPKKKQEMIQKITRVKEDGDSIGGIVEAVINNVPAGIGEPMFNGIENRISNIIFGIPAVKGIEFGAGFSVSGMRGSQCNDEFVMGKYGINIITNNCGGILGGITNGMPIVFRVAFKPTPSISKPQKTVNLVTGEEEIISVQGRHDPCIVPRAVPCVEAAAAIAVYDMLLDRRDI